jgi:hypothetical protein
MYDAHVLNNDKVTEQDTGTNTGDNPGYDSYDDIPEAAPNVGDVTHFSFAGSIYTWVIGLGYSTFDGAYSSLTGKPTIPSGNEILDWTTDQGATNIDAGNYSASGGSTDAADINIADAANIITGTNTETALQENRVAININSGKATNPFGASIDASEVSADVATQAELDANATADRAYADTNDTDTQLNETQVDAFANNNGYAPTAAPTFTGLITTEASDSSEAGLNIPPGVAPTSPANGDIWTTSTGTYARINGATVGPYGVAGSGTDANAIHDNTASEISGITEKGTPVSGDFLIIEDSADSNNKKRIQVGSLPGDGYEANTDTQLSNAQVKTAYENNANTNGVTDTEKSNFHASGSDDQDLSGYVLLDGASGQTVVGGTGVTDKLELQGTSGNGTAASPAVEINVGNDGATNAITVLNNGDVQINGSAGTEALNVAGAIYNEGLEVEVASKNKTQVYLNDSAGNYLVYQPYYWNGSDWVATKSYGFGHQSLYNNTGVYSSGFGHSALRNNTGVYSSGFGVSALRYNQNDNNTAIGSNAWSTFLTNAGGAENFDYTDIDAGTDRITITTHGFGTNNSYINLTYTEGTSAITGLTDGTIYQVKIIDVDTIGFYEGSRGVNITAVGTGTGHTLTPQYNYENSICIGADTVPTASNQVVIGGSATTQTLLRGKVTLDGSAPTASLTLPAGTATASTAPLKLTSGTLVTTPEAGAFEFDGTDLFFTPSAARETVVFAAGAYHDGFSDFVANEHIDWTTDQGATNIDPGNYTAGGGSGSVTTIKENDSGVGGADIVTLDFLGADFNLTESPDTEIQIVIADAIARDAEIVTYCETTQNYLKTSENSDSDDDVTAADLGAASANIANDGTIEWEDAVGLDSDGDLTDEILQDKAGAMWTGNVETRVEVTYQDDDGTIDIVVDDMNDDVPDAGDFGAATDLDLNGAINAEAVTLAKQANMATASLVYRKTAGAGAPEVNTLATLKTDLGLTDTNSGDNAANTTYADDYRVVNFIANTDYLPPVGPVLNNGETSAGYQDFLEDSDNGTNHVRLLGPPSTDTVTINLQNVAGTIAHLDSNITGTAANLSGTPTLPNGTTATTQSASDGSTKLATCKYADDAAGGGVAVTLNASATTGGMSISTQEISNRAATNAQTGYATAAQITALELNTAKLTFGTDPDVATDGYLGVDTDDDSIRGTSDSGTTQFVYGERIKWFTVTITKPLDLDEADNLVVMWNKSPFSFVITVVDSESEIDCDYTLLEMDDRTDFTDTTEMEEYEIDTAGTGVYTDTDATSYTIETGHGIAFNNDAADDPDSITFTVSGYFNGDVD